MGTRFITNRRPRIEAYCPIKGSGGITVYDSPYWGTGNPIPIDVDARYEWYPNAFELSKWEASVSFSLPGITSYLTLRIGTGGIGGTTHITLPGPNTPIPVNLYLEADVQYQVASGYDGFHITKTIPLFTTLSTRPFQINGWVKFSSECLENNAYDTLNDTFVTSIGGRQGGKSILRGVLNGAAFGNEFTHTRPDNLSNTGTTLQGDMEVLVSTAGTMPYPAGYPSRWVFKGSPGASASISMSISDTSGETYLRETLKGQTIVTGRGGEIADATNGVSVFVPGRGAPYAPDRYEGYSAHAKLSGLPSKSYRIRGRAFAVNQPYPDPLKMLFRTNVIGTGSYFTNRTMVNGAVDTGVVKQVRFFETLDTRSGNAVSDAPSTYYHGGGVIVNEQGAVSVAFDKASLAKYGEHPDDSDFDFHGHTWDAFTVSQKPAQTIDSAESLVTGGGDFPGRWEPIGETTLTTITPDGDDAPPSAIKVMTPKHYTPPAPTGDSPVKRELGIRRTFTPAAWLTGYRYLEITVRSREEARRPLVLRFGQKLWFLATGNTDDWRTVTVDLCEEQATMDGKPLPLVSTRDSIRWNYNPSTGITDPGEAPYFGVNQSEALELIGFAVDAVYEIGPIRLLRKSAPLISFIAPQTPQRFIGSSFFYTNEWGDEWYRAARVSTEPASFFQRGTMANTDGRMSLEEPLGTYVRATDRIFQGPSIRRLSDFIGKSANFTSPSIPLAGMQARRNPSWVTNCLCDPVTTDPTAYFLSTLKRDTLDSNKSARFVWGQGSLWRDGKTCVPGVDIAVPDTGLTVPAQWRFIIFDWWPGAGDVFGFGRSSEDATQYRNSATVELRVSKVFRGQARNLIVGDGALPDASGEKTNRVRLKEHTTRATGGEAAGDGIGRYATGRPFAKMTEKTTYSAETGAYTPRRRLYDAVLNGSATGSTSAAALGTDTAKQTPHTDGLLFEARRQRRIVMRARGGGIPSLLSDPQTGFFARVTARRRGIEFQRAAVPVPDGAAGSASVADQWLPASVVTSPDSPLNEVFTYPSLARFPSGQLIVLWERQTVPPDDAPEGTPWVRSIQQSISDDEGETWGDAETLTGEFMANARQPCWFRGIGGDMGTHIRVHVVPDDSDGGDAPTEGKLYGRQYDAGAPNGATFPFLAYIDAGGGTYVPLKIALGSGYDGLQAYDTSGRWLMSLTVPGEDDLSDWASSDEGRHWVRLAAS